MKKKAKAKMKGKGKSHPQPRDKVSPDTPIALDSGNIAGEQPLKSKKSAKKK